MLFTSSVQDKARREAEALQQAQAIVIPLFHIYIYIQIYFCVDGKADEYARVAAEVLQQFISSFTFFISFGQEQARQAEALQKAQAVIRPWCHRLLLCCLGQADENARVAAEVLQRFISSFTFFIHSSCPLVRNKPDKQKLFRKLRQ